MRDETEWLTAAAPRPWTNRVTPWLVAVLLVAGGFAAGVAVPQDDAGAVAGPGQRQAGAGQFQPGAGQFQPGAEGGPAGGTGQQSTGAEDPPTVGTIKLVDGDTVYVETDDGTVVIVRTDDATAVRVPGDLDGLAVGAAVSVEGATATDGTVSAESIVTDD
ncbi:hypothetical protein [Micromonospora sp. NBC_01813]|uniref:hypothetical protein n=1 Tax=Micromonospora sp. NBC_01813 TaxID=2975988 RepID=UPI002DDA617D|nr:hypothetical protein [Micromonospora sp. NBC_01813]WSA07347.1 hypothetical protein OG958_24285 [Micromonospora sp. NBC_01813]